MRSTLSGPDIIPVDELGDVARRITFSSVATPAAILSNKSSVALPGAAENKRIDSTDKGGSSEKRKVSTRKANESRDFEPIAVVLRMRPLTGEEERDGFPAVTIDRDRSGVIHVVPRNPALHSAAIRSNGRADFRFSKLFDTSATQEEVFLETTFPLVEALFNGKNGLVFAYGTSNAGKTYTIQGTAEEPGILPRSLDVIFNSIAKAKGNLSTGCDEEISSDVKALIGQIDKEIPSPSSKMMKCQEPQELSKSCYNAKHPRKSKTISIQSEPTYTVVVSYLEIYNEQCYDLLVKPTCVHSTEDHVSAKLEPCLSAKIEDEFACDSKLPTSPRPRHGAKIRREVLKLKEDRVLGEVNAVGLTEVRVANVKEVEKLLLFGQHNRSVAQTSVNDRSSRSHTIFCVKLAQEARDLRSDGRRHSTRIKTSKLSIVDLAGNERTSRTNNTGQRLKEASLINTSLMNLGHCLDTMRQNQRLMDSVPLRGINVNIAVGNRNLSRQVAGTTGSRKLLTVPFRQSKLTRLFQQNLENGLAVMIANVSPAFRDADETIHSLRRAAIAREVTTMPSSNRLRPVRSNKGGPISPSKLLCVKRHYENKAEADGQRIASLLAEVAALKNIIDENKMEFGLERQELEREQDELWRENEMLRDRLSHAESRFAVRERELREEIMQATQEILAEKDERYRQELAQLWSSGQEAAHARSDIVMNTARKKIERMEERHRKEIGSTIARRVSMAVMPQVFNDDDAGSCTGDEFEGNDEPLDEAVHDGFQPSKQLKWDELEVDNEEYDEEDYEEVNDDRLHGLVAQEDDFNEFGEAISQETESKPTTTGETCKSEFRPLSDSGHRSGALKLERDCDGACKLPNYGEGFPCGAFDGDCQENECLSASLKHEGYEFVAKSEGKPFTENFETDQSITLRKDMSSKTEDEKVAAQSTAESSAQHSIDSVMRRSQFMCGPSSDTAERKSIIQNSTAGPGCGDGDMNGLSSSFGLSNLKMEGIDECSRIGLYGDDISAFQTKITAMLSTGQLQCSPVGPIGEHINVIDPLWAETVEKAIGYVHLSSYLVSSAREARLLKGIFAGLVKCQTLSAPKFIVVKMNQSRQPGSRALCLRGAQFKVMTDVIHVLNDSVYNYLVSKCGIDRIALAEGPESFAKLATTSSRGNIHVAWDQSGRRAVLSDGTYVLRPLRKSAQKVRHLLKIESHVSSGRV